MEYTLIEIWQGKSTVDIDGVRYQFQSKEAWEVYKFFRSQPLPFTHQEALAQLDADQYKVVSHVR